MYFHIMTLFPEMVLGGLNESITGKAIEKGLIGVDAVNIRDFAGNRYGHVDVDVFNNLQRQVRTCVIHRKHNTFDFKGFV